jgi:hypothetical protein
MTKSTSLGSVWGQRRLFRQFLSSFILHPSSFPYVAALAFAAALLPAALSEATGSKPAASGSKPIPTRKSTPKPMPTFEAVKGVVTAQLKKNRYYKPGDVLSRNDVDPMFGKLATLGWKVDDRKMILDQVLPDDYYLVRALRSPDNGFFMRQVATVPDGYGYDRLDRISRMGDGRILIDRIMYEPGGWQFVEIMSETKEAPGMASAFSMGPGGKGFTTPTGRIYTEQQLIARLKQSYDKATLKKAPAKEPGAKEPSAKKP